VAVYDEIEALAQRILAELDSVYDYKEHTTVIWRVFQRWVQQGHTVKSTNVDTGNVVTERDLVGLAQRYNSEYLLEFTFQHIVSLSETFIFDLLRLLLIDDPEHRISGKKQFDMSTILSVPDRTSLVALIADRELNDLKYKRVTQWFERLNDIVSVSCPSEDEIGSYAEIKASRDILVHNAKVVNDTYVRKAGAKGRFQSGDQMEISGDYHRAAWLLVKKIATDVSAETMAKFAL